MHGKRLFGMCLLLLLLLAGCAAGRPIDQEQFTTSERIVVKFSHVVAENTPKGQAARMFANRVATASQGRVEVQVFPNSELFGDDQELQAIKKGLVHIIAPTPSKLSEVVPQWQVFDLPYAFADEQAVVTAMEGEVGQRLSELTRRRGLETLALWDNGFKQMSSARQPLVQPADFAGQRFRIMPGSRVLQEQFRALGAIPVPRPFHLVYSDLEQGTVDGQENTVSNMVSKRFHELQPYVTVSNHGYLGYVVIANAGFWHDLPVDVQRLLQDAMDETTRWVRDNARRINDEHLTQLQASGLADIRLQSASEREAWATTFAPVYEAFRHEIGDDLIDAILNQAD